MQINIEDHKECFEFKINSFSVFYHQLEISSDKGDLKTIHFFRNGTYISKVQLEISDFELMKITKHKEVFKHGS